MRKRRKDSQSERAKEGGGQGDRRRLRSNLALQFPTPRPLASEILGKSSIDHSNRRSAIMVLSEQVNQMKNE
jgi:hypothetical protein